MCTPDLHGPGQRIESCESDIWAPEMNASPSSLQPVISSSPARYTASPMSGNLPMSMKLVRGPSQNSRRSSPVHDRSSMTPLHGCSVHESDSTDLFKKSLDRPTTSHLASETSKTDRRRKNSWQNPSLELPNFNSRPDDPNELAKRDSDPDVFLDSNPAVAAVAALPQLFLWDRNFRSCEQDAASSHFPSCDQTSDEKTPWRWRAQPETQSLETKQQPQLKSPNMKNRKQSPNRRTKSPQKKSPRKQQPQRRQQQRRQKHLPSSESKESLPNMLGDRPEDQLKQHFQEQQQFFQQQVQQQFQQHFPQPQLQNPTAHGQTSTEISEDFSSFDHFDPPWNSELGAPGRHMPWWMILSWSMNMPLTEDSFQKPSTAASSSAAGRATTAGSAASADSSIMSSFLRPSTTVSGGSRGMQRNSAPFTARTPRSRSVRTATKITAQWIS
eukprot:TRINITY_DN9104_c0_g2_i1.p1 TRINITY_DN9104_c0_g2~~TRINITY_DN9104_c0_g2_i1.p1  ORF type:complete len:442 (-),score=46.96 TRINITY_DN9104_c0_g2_i1:67-1392(-)